MAKGCGGTSRVATRSQSRSICGCREGQRILRDLAAKADVLVENFRPGTLDKWGIGFAALKEINPRLVMLSISGYGQTGPYASRAAYDRIGLAFSGLLHITGEADRPPLRPGTAMADYQSAIMGAFSVMMSLYHRDAKGGTGQQIDVSLYKSIFRFTDVLITAYDKLGVSRQRGGNLHFAAAPGDHFETSDGRYLALTVSSNGVFQRLCKAMANPALPKMHVSQPMPSAGRIFARSTASSATGSSRNRSRRSVRRSIRTDWRIL